MALPPCHVMAQFNVREGKWLSCCLFQRSGDVGLGVPFNIASYAFLTHILAKHCDLMADEFVYFLGNAHIYEEHVEALNEQIKKTPYPFPTINIINKYDSIEEYGVDDIIFVNEYRSHDPIKMEMKA
jgi:thymidylate synthase